MPDDAARVSWAEYITQAERTPAQRLPGGTTLVDLAGPQPDAPVIHASPHVEIGLECLSATCTWGKKWLVNGRIAFRGHARCPRCRVPLTSESGWFLRGVVTVRVIESLPWRQET